MVITLNEPIINKINCHPLSPGATELATSAGLKKKTIAKGTARFYKGRSKVCMHKRVATSDFDRRLVAKVF